MGKLWNKTRARWQRWQPQLGNRSSSISSEESWPSSSSSSRTTGLGRHLMEQLDTESKGVEYCTAISSFRVHVANRLQVYNYKHEHRVLIQLANFAPVVRLLKSGVDSAVNIINPIGLSVKAKWHQYLQEEREEQMEIFRNLLTNDRLLRRELGDENQQVEILTRLKHSLEKYDDELAPAELDVISAAYDSVVRLSNTIAVEIPEWFALSGQEWNIATRTVLRRGEEECIRIASVWSELNHPNVLKFFGACHVGRMPFVIHDECLLLKDKPFSWRYVLDIARGLEYLHDRGLVQQRLWIGNLYATSIGGVVSGMDLVPLPRSDDNLPGQNNERNASNDPSLANDTFAFESILDYLIDGETNYFAGISSTTSRQSAWRESLSLESHLLGEAAVQLQASPTMPTFANEDVWRLLVGICNRDLIGGVTWIDIIYKVDLLAQQEGSRDSTRYYDSDEVIGSLEVYTFGGKGINAMLDEAESLCMELEELRAVNQPVLDRLIDVYEQLKHCETPLYLRVVENFVSIVRRFTFILDKRGDYYSSLVASACASRTIAGRNFRIHHDIDRLIFGSSSLRNEDPVHLWQTGWESVRQEQCDAVQALVANSTSYLNGLNSDEDRREALAFLQYEALHCGTTRISVTTRTNDFAPALPRIDEYDGLPKWFIPPHQIEFGRHLADGSFGAVYEGTWRGTEVVVKQVLTDQKSATARAQFRQEVDLWFSLNHDNLIKLYGACHVGQAAFVCEKATRGTLVSFVKGKERWEIWKCIYEAALGLLYLHDRGIVHGDLKGNNILVCQGNVKLADFGLSFVAKQAHTVTLGGTGALGAYRWKAPECLKGDRPTYASDIYSFGMCVVEALTGEPPWRNVRDDVVKCKVVDHKCFPSRPNHIDSYDWELASRMCCFDPADRITANAVVSYVYDQFQALRYLHDARTNSYGVYSLRTMATLHLPGLKF